MSLRAVIATGAAVLISCGAASGPPADTRSEADRVIDALTAQAAGRSNGPSTGVLTPSAVPTAASAVLATQAAQPTAIATPPPTPTAAATPPPAPTVVPTSVRTPIATPVLTPVQAVSFSGNGTYVVGKDIAPGTYRTRSHPAFSCYWERMRDFTASSSEVIAAEYPDGPAIVTIAATDKGFKSDGCPPWTQDLSALKSPTAQFFGGTFFVGLEVAPGRWRTTAGAVKGTCTWSRLSGFGSGDPSLGDARGDIIASGGAQTGDVYVTISAADKGFTSSRCGGWIKVG